MNLWHYSCITMTFLLSYSVVQHCCSQSTLNQIQLESTSFSLIINELIISIVSLVCAIYTEYSFQQKCNSCTTLTISGVITFKMLKPILEEKDFWHGSRGSFVCNQPMRVDVTLQCHLSLARHINKMISEDPVCRQLGYHTHLISNQTELNLLWPVDVISRHKTGSTMVQVMICRLPAPSHYLNQCWLGIQCVHQKATSQDTSI